MPLIRFLVSKRYTYIVVVILLLGEIMPLYSRYKEKKLVYITIIALSSRQPSFYIKCTKSNIYLSYNIRSVSNIKYTKLNIHLSCNVRSVSNAKYI